MVRHTLKHSKRPLLVAGHGIRIAKAQEELLKLELPLVTTFNGFDLVPNDHPYFVGRIGSLGTHGGNHALKTADLVIFVGTRNNMRQISFDWKTFCPQAETFIVDIDDAELHKYKSKGICCDAKDFLKDLLKIGYKCNPEWLQTLKKYDQENPTELTPPYKFIHDLTSKLPNDAIVVCGIGTACIAMFQAGIVKKGQRIFWNSGCATMGYDLPASIGACLASGKEVICITGDGSIQMNLQEFQTIKHYKLPIKTFVLNNNGYRSIKLTQSNYFKGDFIGCDERSGVSFPSLKKLANLYDLKYYLGYDKLEEILYYPYATLCEVMIGDNYIFQKGLV